MAIKAGDIKLLASAVMDDVPEGGGAPSNHVIQDNVSNEIFKDISESDRARGRFNASKVHVSVQSEDTDTYLGANVIIGRPPEDPNVAITLFTTNDVYDTRTQAISRLEAYLNKSAEWHGLLYENHISGQRTVQLFQRVGTPTPEVGYTLCLSQNENSSSHIEQYIRVTRVSSFIRTFTHSDLREYQALIVTLELSDALRYDFRGTSANIMFKRADTAAFVRDTTVADAAVYAGVVPLAQPISVGDFSLKATGIYTQLVPSAQVETPIVATSPSAVSGAPARSQRSLTYTTSQAWTPTTDLLLPGGCTPGTLTVLVGSTTIKDVGGVLMVGDSQVGIVDYANGILNLSSASYSGSKNITYEPCAYVQRMPQTVDIPVTQSSRSLNYVGFMVPTPAPGTMSISYLVQNRWYVLSDDGSGALRGFDASYGAGNVNYLDGNFVVTLGALPDVGSAIIIQWGVPTQEYSHPVTNLRLQQTIDLEVGEDETLNPGLMDLSWDDGSPRTASVSIDGKLSGDAWGMVNLGLNQLEFTPKSLPPYGTMVTATYDVGPRTIVDLPHPVRDGTGHVPLDSGSTNLVPGSVVVEWNTYTDITALGVYTADQMRDMGILPAVNPPPPQPGSGWNFIDPIHTARDDGMGRLFRDGMQVGTVDYVDGTLSLWPDAEIQVPTPQYSQEHLFGNLGDGTGRWRLNYEGVSYTVLPTIYPNDETGWVRLKFYEAGADTRKTTTFMYQPRIKLSPGNQAPVVPGSVILTVGGGLIWGDSGSGVLREIQSDGSALQRGEIDYAAGELLLTSWPVGVSGEVTRTNLISTLGENVSSAYTFRTAAAPVRPGTLSIQFARAGGGVQTVTAGIDGTITGSGVQGTVDYQTGLVRLGFGNMVAAAGNENEPWYNPNYVVGGMVFKPSPVPASTVKYTAVAYSYMPLNADIVGVDPVRLPSDGRVPIFRSGTMVVVGNTKTLTGVTPTNGMTVSLGRTRLSRAVVRDNTGAALYTGYTVDLEAGLVEFTDVSAMATPVSIEHRIEDMLVAREVEISGQMTFTRQISHTYPVEGTYVSSALEFGDRKARVSVVFDQATWNGVEWFDSQQGASAAGTYNTVLSPIEVTNIGASSERFALWFTSTTAFRIIGEHVGQIGTGDINTVCAPINPATGQPYFVVNPLGWGTGWAVGNVLRINTVGALAPVWVARTVQPGAESGIDYSFDILTRGDVDRP